jgi:hypothetical protein
MENIVNNAHDQGNGRSRVCPVSNCGKPINGHHCMCASHWNAAPIEMRHRVLMEASIRRGSLKHLESIYDAVKWIESNQPKTKPSSQFEFYDQ